MGGEAGTHLEQYGIEQGVIRPGFEPMDSPFGRFWPEAFERNPADFGRTVMELLHKDFGAAPLDGTVR
jgi:hypothetical protein